ncbi:hypothetical protein [Shimia sp. MIT1388]|uniref:hypothetical protein n=1 Tax=Shimia sp. MIT1388 TaxID=3096992 RepID=UPI00399AFDD9
MTTATLSPELELQLSQLIAALGQQSGNTAAAHMLIENRLISEADVSELRRERPITTRNNRIAGKMPPHYRWGGLICYRWDDIASVITAELVENAAHRRKRTGG